MKRILCFFLLIVLLIPVLGCSQTDRNEDKIKIVALSFPEYDWTRQILGEIGAEAELILLCDNGTDVHSYQPSVSDMADIASCDLLICLGGESDRWIDDAVAASPSAKRTVLRLMPLLQDNEKLVEQTQHTEDDHHHDALYDEHVWLSLRFAERFCRAIAAELAKLFPDFENRLEESCSNYTNTLAALDLEYSACVSASPEKTLLFADRFPFTYFAADYGLVCYAAFSGCSSETEASFQTVSFLAETLNALRLSAVIILERSSDDLAKTIISTSGSQQIPIFVLNSMQSVSLSEIRSGATYLSIMEENLIALKAALGQ